ncbi:F0F1 ATP synthase subunit A [Thermoanaerobacterium sp. RBIITD]|uniref:F0F1 ATP synthase subunit A n=1 Tax=Thermoanaerobacterium sp. RBIITD TaxID=1550240 RepID=UPI000BB9996C|nr:F0F1 ATP synthase subunit A [Thermoanaerobacterium sp. RBIITD]SNX52949.1 F-type H+-transporting ATPase subunit a [Thermoanaerobacterium sp. RBIITD]
MSIDQPVVFKIPIFGGIPVTSTVVVTWIIMAILTVASITVTRGWKLIPTGVQNVVETVVDGLNSFTKDALGKYWVTFTPYLGTVALYLILANTIDLFGLTPPTDDLSATSALAVMSIIVVIIASIKAKGVKGYAKSFFEPMPFFFPMKILDMFTRPLSLAARLFGNIIAAFIIMGLISKVVPIVVPAIFSIYFDLFDGALQMVVFVFLTMLYIEEAVE